MARGNPNKIKILITVRNLKKKKKFVRGKKMQQHIVYNLLQKYFQKDILIKNAGTRYFKYKHF